MTKPIATETAPEKTGMVLPPLKTRKSMPLWKLQLNGYRGGKALGSKKGKP